MRTRSSEVFSPMQQAGGQPGTQTTKKEGMKEGGSEEGRERREIT